MATAVTGSRASHLAHRNDNTDNSNFSKDSHIDSHLTKTKFKSQKNLNLKVRVDLTAKTDSM